MSETQTVNESTDSQSHPFETTEDGLYIVPQQTDGYIPDSVAIRMGDTEYVLTDYCGTIKESRMFPNVLAYEHCSVSDV